jgi:hypothetical protein
MTKMKITFDYNETPSTEIIDGLRAYVKKMRSAGYHIQVFHRFKYSIVFTRREEIKKFHLDNMSDAYSFLYKVANDIKFEIAKSEYANQTHTFYDFRGVNVYKLSLTTYNED